MGHDWCFQLSMGEGTKEWPSLPWRHWAGHVGACLVRCIGIEYLGSMLRDPVRKF
jgi:hypothetical protein